MILWLKHHIGYFRKDQEIAEVICICNTVWRSVSNKNKLHSNFQDRCNEKIPMYNLPKRGKGVCYLKSKYVSINVLQNEWLQVHWELPEA